MIRARTKLTLVPALALAFAGLLILPTAASARTQPGVHSHMGAKKHKRISRREAKRLQEQRWKIKRIKKRARRDGFISYFEAKRIRKAESKLWRMKRQAFRNNDRRTEGRRVGHRGNRNTRYDDGFNRNRGPNGRSVAARNVDYSDRLDRGDHRGASGRDRVYERDASCDGDDDRDHRRHGKRNGKRGNRGDRAQNI